MSRDAARPDAPPQLAPKAGLLAGRRWLLPLVGLVVVALVAVLLIVSLSGSSSKPPPASATVRVAHSRFGPILVNAAGLTYYMFRHDSSHSSACSQGCERVWPPAIDKGTPTLGAGLDSRRLTAITRPDHRRQLAYNGHPLYLFSEDSKPGQVGGEAFLHTWYVLSPAGRPVRLRGEKASTGGGGGY